MTKRGWLWGNDISAMIDYCWGKISDRQFCLFLAAGYRLFPDQPALAEKARFWAEQTNFITTYKNEPQLLLPPYETMLYSLGELRGSNQFDTRLACILRSIVGNPFQPRIRFWHLRWEEREGVSTIKGCLQDHREEDVIWDHPIFSWRDGAIPKLARSIYEGEDWEAVPILGDAVKEAEYTDPVILNHLDGLEPCWYCRGKGRVVNHTVSTDLRIDCPTCKTAGWAKRRVPFFRGDWLIDRFAGFE